MRTKTLILSALCGLMGSAAAMAQVYSVNAVGYVNVTCKPGFSIIANPLNAGTGTNKLSALIPSAPDMTMVYEYINGNFQTATYYVGDGWDNDLNLAPGTGAWINNPATTNITLTFVGEVMQGDLTNTIPVGLSLKSSIVPQSGQLDTLLNYTPSDLDMVYFFRNGTFQTCTYYAGDGWDTPPVPAVGEGFWISTSTAKDWTRSFKITN